MFSFSLLRLLFLPSSFPSSFPSTVFRLLLFPNIFHHLFSLPLSFSLSPPNRLKTPMSNTNEQFIDWFLRRRKFITILYEITLWWLESLPVEASWTMTKLSFCRSILKSTRLPISSLLNAQPLFYRETFTFPLLHRLYFSYPPWLHCFTSGSICYLTSGTSLGVFGFLLWPLFGRILLQQKYLFPTSDKRHCSIAYTMAAFKKLSFMTVGLYLQRGPKVLTSPT